MRYVRGRVAQSNPAAHQTLGVRVAQRRRPSLRGSASARCPGNRYGGPRAAAAAIPGVAKATPRRGGVAAGIVGWLPAAGVSAMVLDIAKGMPFVALAHYYFELPMVAVMAIGLCAILGHAYSPLMHFRGGKALAVTGGVMFALPQHEIVISVLTFMFLGFLFIDVDGWRVMFSMGASLIYLAVTKGISSLEPLFIICVIAILALTHFDELKTMPRFRGKLITWLQARKMAKLRGQ